MSDSLKRHLDSNCFLLAKNQGRKLTVLKKILFIVYLHYSFTKDLLRAFKNIFSEPSGQNVKLNFLNIGVCLYETDNNLRSILPIVDHLGKVIFLSFSDKNRLLLKNRNIQTIHFSDSRVNFKLIKNKYCFLFYILWKKEYSSYYFKSISDSYFRNEFSYINFSNALKSGKPKFIITSNDVNSFSRILVYASNEFQVPNFFVQHSSISDNDRNLNFTKAYLFSQSIFNSYKKVKASRNSSINIVGNHLLDSFRTIASQKPNYVPGNEIKIGLAYNSLDNLDKVKAVINEIITSKDCEVITFIKPHPREFRIISKMYGEKIGDLYSFLSRIDLLLTGISGIALDAALCNIMVYQMDWRDKQHAHLEEDYYGFIKKRIVKKVNANKLLNDLQSIYLGKIEIQSRRDYCKYFDASIGEPWEWNVSKKIADEIKAETDKTYLCTSL